MIVRKLLNYAIVNAQRLVQSDTVRGFPYYVVLDPSNVCQLKCVFCDGNERPRVLMNFDEFRRIIDQIGTTCINLELYNWGEPSLNRSLIDMINYASERYGVYTRISSNLNLVNDEVYEQLVRSRLNALTISLDGASAQTYSEYRKNGDFDSVVRNVKLLVSCKRTRRKSEPKLVWQFLVFRHNEHEIERAKALARQLGVNEIVFRKPHVPEEALEWDSTLAAYSNYGIGRRMADKRCRWPYAGIAINANGSVSPCCGVAREEDDFGHLRTSAVSAVWNNHKFREARSYVSDSRLMPSGKNVCLRCTIKGAINFDPSFAEVAYCQSKLLRNLFLKVRGLRIREG